ncbi:MAG: hypothetical protein J6A15_06205 [Clostridia bacterium]|nr:hypothetical protein [Clostridia bacterium]
MYKLGDKVIENCGNKAKYLSILKSKGYNIPLGVVIDFEEFKNIIKLQKLNFETIDKIEIPDELVDRILSILPKDKQYAIRSSANIEDCRNISLAGRFVTFLNVVADKECIKDKIKSCFLSLYSQDNLQFYRKNKIDISKIEMNVIVQEMIESNVSGILFTVNPTNGKDTQIVVEFSKGAGEVVTGKAVPERIVYDWVEEKYIEEPKINLLGETSIKRIINISLNLQQEVGFPIDVEFGVYDSKLYIFQIRPITRVENKDVYHRFTNTTPIESRFMWSLDEKVYNTTTISFIKALKIMNDTEILKPIVDFKFSRIYWNLTLLKKVLENVPGYVERNIDELLDVKIDYLDNGKENLSSKKKINIFAKKNVMDLVKKQLVNIEEFRTAKLQEISTLRQELNTLENEKQLMDNLIKAINMLYDIKSIYTWQSYINFLYQVNINDSLEGILNKAEIKNLFEGVDDKYENGPTLHMWDSSRRIRTDAKRLKFFESNLDAEIYYLYRKDRENPLIKDFLTDFIDTYGYHSFNETDIIYKAYDEEILRVIKMYRDILELDDKFDPLRKLKQQNKVYEMTLDKIKENAKKSQVKGIFKDIDFIRDLIKRKNSLKDLILMAQNILRKYMIELGKIYKSKFIIDSEEDIFNLEYKYIINPVDSENVDQIKKMVSKNRIYLNSFRNYQPLNDIFPCSKQYINIDYSRNLKGIGASFGKISGRACIVNSKEDLKNLRRSDILVTKYMNQEIFKKINISDLAGIITEYGGMLCHLAINARENRIPCVVGLKDATKNIRNGENIIVNGDTGEVKV